MFANDKIGKAIGNLRRQHRLTRDAVDAMPWPHPRPASDERITTLNWAFIYLCLMQIAFGAPGNTVQARSWDDYWATVAYSVLLIVCSGLVLFAAKCRSQYESFGYEMAGTVGYCGTFVIYTLSVVTTVENWWATQTFAVGAALMVGNGRRAVKLIRRLW